MLPIGRYTFLSHKYKVNNIKIHYNKIRISYIKEIRIRYLVKIIIDVFHKYILFIYNYTKKYANRHIVQPT